MNGPLPRRPRSDALRRATLAHAAADLQCVGLCTFCNRWADPAVIIAMVQGNSGPGWTQYAHPGCAKTRGVTPLDVEPPPDTATAAAPDPTP